MSKLFVTLDSQFKSICDEVVLQLVKLSEELILELAAPELLGLISKGLPWYHLSVPDNYIFVVSFSHF